MSSFSSQFVAYMRLALDHAEGRLVGAYSRSIVFEISDGDDFVLDLRGGEISLTTDTRGIDWRGKDWRTASCIHTSEATLLEIMRGELLPTEAFIFERLGWGSRGLADPRTTNRTIYRWVSHIFRLASEEADRLGRAAFLEAIVRGA